jgi:hypothetical protein
MIKIWLFIYEKIIFPVFFTIAFGLYYAFYPALLLKLPRKDFKKEYNEPFGDIRFLAFILIMIAMAFGLSKLIKILL